NLSKPRVIGELSSNLVSLCLVKEDASKQNRINVVKELITFQGDQESFDICPYEVIVCEQILVGNSAMKKYVSKQFCIILGINPVIKGLCFM
ncbi:hypothetical protein LSH36_143g06028, partial [Paralvinella palmiformis]